MSHQVREVSYIPGLTFAVLASYLTAKMLPGCSGRRVGWNRSPEILRDVKTLGMILVFSEYLFASLEVGEIKTGCGGLSARGVVNRF